MRACQVLESQVRVMVQEKGWKGFCGSCLLQHTCPGLCVWASCSTWGPFQVLPGSWDKTLQCGITIILDPFIHFLFMHACIHSFISLPTTLHRLLPSSVFLQPHSLSSSSARAPALGTCNNRSTGSCSNNSNHFYLWASLVVQMAKSLL